MLLTIFLLAVSKESNYYINFICRFFACVFTVKVSSRNNTCVHCEHCCGEENQQENNGFNVKDASSQKEAFNRFINNNRNSSNNVQLVQRYRGFPRTDEGMVDHQNYRLDVLFRNRWSSTYMATTSFLRRDEAS